MRILLRVLCTLAMSLPAALPAADRDFSDAELDRMLAPVALYPDTVLSHVLIAATYPLEIVEAARWSRRHPDLRGADAVDAVEHEDWDASVKALVAFPELLARLDEDLDWTRDLGDAFLAQEEGIADRVQVLRERAYDAGHLESLEHVRVIREPEVIYIEPVVTRVVHVPFYDTRVVYGSWWWPAYPPVVWGFPHHHHAVWYWGVGYHVAPSFYFSAWHWPQRRVVVHHLAHHHRHFRSGRDIAGHHDARQWRHQAAHRRGVAYRHERVRHQHAAAQPLRHGRGDDNRREDRQVTRDDRHHSDRPDRARARRDENPRDADRTRRPATTPRNADHAEYRNERAAPGRTQRAPAADAGPRQRSNEVRPAEERHAQGEDRRAERAPDGPSRSAPRSAGSSQRGPATERRDRRSAER